MGDFKTEKELLEYLISGGSVTKVGWSEDEYVVFNDNGFVIDEHGDKTGLDAISWGLSDYYKYIKLDWYHSIPDQGTLCWVWDSEESEKRLLIVCSHVEGDEQFKTVDGRYWKNAEPLTEEEALSMVYKSDC